LAAKASGLQEYKAAETKRAHLSESGIYTDNCHVLKFDLVYTAPTGGGPYTDFKMSVRGGHGFPSSYTVTGGSYTFLLPGGGTQTDYGATIDINPGTAYTVHYCADPGAVLSAGNLAITIAYKDDNVPKWVRYNLKVHKRICDAASVDSRMGFMDPHADGTSEPTGNEYLRNLNFGSYLYRGGLFLGKMSWTSDQSGIGRIMLWPASGDSITQTMAMGVSLLDTGRRANYVQTNGIVAYYATPASGTYVPGSSTSITESTATWNNQWTFDHDAGDEMGSVSSITDNDYATWMLSKVVDNVLVVPTYATSHFTIALLDEAATSYSWRYFAGDEYEALATSSEMDLGFPFTDCKPRLWIVDLVQVTNGQ